MYFLNHSDGNIVWRVGGVVGCSGVASRPWEGILGGVLSGVNVTPGSRINCRHVDGVWWCTLLEEALLAPSPCRKNIVVLLHLKNMLRNYWRKVFRIEFRHGLIVTEFIVFSIPLFTKHGLHVCWILHKSSQLISTGYCSLVPRHNRASAAGHSPQPPRRRIMRRH